MVELCHATRAEVTEFFPPSGAEAGLPARPARFAPAKDVAPKQDSAIRADRL
jgi:hypothetical protein